MKYNHYRFKATVWLYPGMSGWHFISIPSDIADDIKKEFYHLKRGWGSLKVAVTTGKSTWETSIFPDKETSGYLLPLKADIRTKEKIHADDMIDILLEIKTS